MHATHIISVSASWLHHDLPSPHFGVLSNSFEILPSQSICVMLCCDFTESCQKSYGRFAMLALTFTAKLPYHNVENVNNTTPTPTGSRLWIISTADPAIRRGNDLPEIVLMCSSYYCEASPLWLETATRIMTSAPWITSWAIEDIYYWGCFHIMLRHIPCKFLHHKSLRAVVKHTPGWITSPSFLATSHMLLHVLEPT